MAIAWSELRNNMNELITITNLPTAIASLLEETKQDIGNSLSDNTKRTYRSAWGQFGDWCFFQAVQALPFTKALHDVMVEYCKNHEESIEKIGYLTMGLGIFFCDALSGLILLEQSTTGKERAEKIVSPLLDYIRRDLSGRFGVNIKPSKYN